MTDTTLNAAAGLPEIDERSLGMRIKTQVKHIRYVLTSNPVTLLAFTLFVMIVILGIFGPLIAPYDPLQTNASIALQPPSWSHWFGTDQLGRDVLSRVIVATRLDLLISVCAVAISFAAALRCALRRAASRFARRWTSVAFLAGSAPPSKTSRGRTR